MNNLNPFHPGIADGISLFTAIKDRKENFEAALQTWVCQELIDEIIILDWDSEESLVPLIEKYQNGKIFLAIAPDQPVWILSHAFNLAARLTTRNKILKMDADVKIMDGFFQNHVLSEGVFFTGNSGLSRNENEMHLNGLLYLNRNDFFRVNGYNERIRTYGWDDTDLFSRLGKLGLDRRDISPDFVFHIEHHNRTVNQPKAKYFNHISDEEWARHQIFKNRYLTAQTAIWTTGDKMTEFTHTADSGYVIRCSHIGHDNNRFPSDLENPAMRQAIIDRLGEFDLQISSDDARLISDQELLAIYHCYINFDQPQKECTQHLVRHLLFHISNEAFSNKKLDLIYNSISWKLGHSVVSLLAKITLLFPKSKSWNR